MTESKVHALVHKVNGIEFDGKADDYLVWITSELLPYLKKCFSISEEQKDIAIAGASLGA